MNRRAFLQSAGLASLAFPSVTFGADKKLRVAIIGHTGRGDYGHGLDTVWLSLAETEIVAVADANPKGLETARARLKVERGFADYRQMLEQSRPDIVAICPRHADQHHDMALAAAAAGVRGVYMEKPFCRTPAEADALVAACQRTGMKLAVAHRNRYHPVLKTVDKMIADGAIGRLLELRGRGKEDARGGGEDLWVLGSHVLNLMAYFGGQPRACAAVLEKDDRPVTKADVQEGREGLGPLAGNKINARFDMERGVPGYFDSIQNAGKAAAGFGLQLVGNQGIIDLRCDRQPLAHLMPGNPFQPVRELRPWIAISTAGAGKPEPMEQVDADVAKHIIPARDLMAAIREDRQPLCGVRDSATVVEMISAVFESHRQGGARVVLPLKNRANALASLS
ncbi:MAG: Gfo/Idh/MocA family oxidoreductase [Pedosphaera sp.]|nr:Gfo/Idh/MocA family oxidoreductase [Pedosphaera sp.]MSU44309.1 Gfo/Idh/MocA family oxidoreductase [Pedosphaera sp.]